MGCGQKDKQARGCVPSRNGNVLDNGIVCPHWGVSASLPFALRILIFVMLFRSISPRASRSKSTFLTRTFEFYVFHAHSIGLLDRTADCFGLRLPFVQERRPYWNTRTTALGTWRVELQELLEAHNHAVFARGARQNTYSRWVEI